MAGFRENGGQNIKILIFTFKTPKRHILAWDHVFWRILREDQFGIHGCKRAEEPKTNILGVIFHSYGEKKSLSDLDKILHCGRYTIIAGAKFGDDRLRRFCEARCQILGFSIGFRRRPYNTLALPCECLMRFLYFSWYSLFTFIGISYRWYLDALMCCCATHEVAEWQETQTVRHRVKYNGWWENH